MTAAGSVAGLCVVRDACDLVGFSCGHYLRMGFSHLAFVDDGSTDGTFELLESISRIDPRVSVRRVVAPAFHQAELASEAAAGLIARGCRILVPFDVDEFWNVSARVLDARCAGRDEIAFRGRWINYVQRREAVHARRRGLLTIAHRVSGDVAADRRTVAAFERPFVCCAGVKVGCKSRGPVEFDTGHHTLLQGPDEFDAQEYEIFHVPLRARSELVKRGLNYEPRRAPVRVDPEVSWQSVFHRDVVLGGRVDEAWAANSSHRGHLDCFGTRLALRRDRRLQRLLLLSLAYLAVRLGRMAWPRHVDAYVRLFGLAAPIR